MENEQKIERRKINEDRAKRDPSGVCGCVGVCGCGVVGVWWCGRVMVWACVWGVWGVFGVCVRACGGVRALGERKYRSPLYYPDTLVNLDTCLGKMKLRIVCFGLF